LSYTRLHSKGRLKKQSSFTVKLYELTTKVI